MTSLAPNPGPTNAAAVAVISVRWAGSQDDLNPNNEYVELTIDPRFYPLPTYKLEGLTLRNNKNEKFTFPIGSSLQSGQTLKVYSGLGKDPATELYWGRNSGAWDNSGDCVHLIRPNGVVTYALSYGAVSCATFGSNSVTSAAISHEVILEEGLAPR